MVLRRIRFALLLAALAVAAAHAQNSEPRAPLPAQQRAAQLRAASAASGSIAASAASTTKPVCVDAEVDGQRALSYDCLSSQLQPKPTAPAGASQSAAQAAANAPSNRLGTFNLSTERNRFGANWGNSVTPQRPAAPVAVPPK